MVYYLNSVDGTTLTMVQGGMGDRGSPRAGGGWLGADKIGGRVGSRTSGWYAAFLGFSF